MKDHATATSSADPMPGGSKLSKKASPKGPKAKASPAAKKASSPATTKTKDSTSPPTEKPNKTPTEKSTPPADTTEEKQPKKTRTKSPDKSANKTRGRSPPSNSPRKNPKKARTESSPKKPSPKKAPKSGPKTSGEGDDGKKKSGKDSATVENKKKAHKLYMRFWRSVNESHGLRSDNEVLLFSSFPIRKTKMSTLYEDFMQCQGKWANSYIMKTIRQKHKNGKRAARRWLTRAQLKAHFNDDSVVDAIIVRKEADSELAEKEIRDHPDLPGLKQYLVLIEDEEVDESTDEIEELFCMQQKHSSDSSSDGSQDESDDDSSSNASAAAKKKDKKCKKDKKDKKSKKNKAKKSKNKGKGKRKGKNKLNRAETQEDLDKEQSRKVQQEGKKVINTLNRKIKDATSKIESKEVSSLNELVRDALKKDLQAVVKKLTSARTQLQSALDSVQDDRITHKTTAAKEILDQAEGSLTVGVKKKTEKKGGD
ncbi:unnamed protein product [Symbiodinium sp. CCMP2592]|nr:unnamed protein product [Symbiodinium sp. CCMP2592]